jgi:hypothetical protein
VSKLSEQLDMKADDAARHVRAELRQARAKLACPPNQLAETFTTHIRSQLEGVVELNRGRAVAEYEKAVVAAAHLAEVESKLTATAAARDHSREECAEVSMRLDASISELDATKALNLSITSALDQSRSEHEEVAAELNQSRYGALPSLAASRP